MTRSRRYEKMGDEDRRMGNLINAHLCYCEAKKALHDKNKQYWEDVKRIEGKIEKLLDDGVFWMQYDALKHREKVGVK